MFFDKKYVVIALARTNIVAAEVSTKGDGKVKRSLSYKSIHYPDSWSSENLVKILKDIGKKLKPSEVRVLLSDDLSYVLPITIPDNLDNSNERERVLEKTMESVPDEISGSEWDFKEIGEVATETGKVFKKIIVFVPVRGIIPVLRSAFKQVKYKAVAIEPEVVAKSRNENPLIGIALKQDLKGKDKNVLNVSL